MHRTIYIRHNNNNTVFFFAKESTIFPDWFCGRSTFRPNDPFDPWHVIGHSGVDAGRVPIAAIFPERRYTNLTRHTRVVGVFYLQRAARIALW